MTLHHFDLRGRVCVQLLTYVDMGGWKVSIVLLSANALWDMFVVKKCVCTHLLTHESMIMCSFEHNFPLDHPMRRVSTKLYQLRDVTTCKFSLKRGTTALVWLTWTPPCATFDICGHVWAEKFHCFAHCERTMRCVHCKTTCVYIAFQLTKTCICVTIITTLCFPPTFPSIYLNSHTITWLFYLQIIFNIYY